MPPGHVDLVRVCGRLGLGLLIGLVWSAPAAGAAPDAVEIEDDADADAIAQAKQLNSRAEARYRLGDYLGAIELWEQAYALVPRAFRADLQSKLAATHLEQYAIDYDISHQHRARTLLEALVRELDASETVTLELRRAEIAACTAEIERVEARERERERERELAELAAREEVARLAAIESLRDEQDRLDNPKRDKNVMIAGGAVLGLGVGSLAVMGLGLGLGLEATREGRQMVAMDPSLSAAELQPLVESGERTNLMATITGVAGGVFVLSGASMVVVAALRRKRARGGSSARARVRLDWGQLRF